MILILEWGGAVIGLAGAALLATHCKFSRYGWVLFLIANLVFIAWAIQIKATGLLVQQIGFTFTSLLGIYRSGLVPTFSCKNSSGEAPYFLAGCRSRILVVGCFRWWWSLVQITKETGELTTHWHPRFFKKK